MNRDRFKSFSKVSACFRRIETLAVRITCNLYCLGCSICCELVAISEKSRPSRSARSRWLAVSCRRKECFYFIRPASFSATLSTRAKTNDTLPPSLLTFRLNILLPSVSSIKQIVTDGVNGMKETRRGILAGGRIVSYIYAAICSAHLERWPSG